MGANFAPSYTNLTMGQWENQFIWNNNPFAQHVIFFGRYIDDIVIIWGGSLSQVDDFVAHCNANDLGLSFTAVWSRDSLAFLDLELSHEDVRIFARNYAKATAGKSYLHYDSCHHPQWVNNIPKGQADSGRTALETVTTSLKVHISRRSLLKRATHQN